MWILWQKISHNQRKYKNMKELITQYCNKLRLTICSNRNWCRNYNSKCVTDISFCFIFQKQNNKEKIWKWEKRNIAKSAINIKENHEKDSNQYRLGTKSSVLEGFFHRIQFQVTLVNFMYRYYVPIETMWRVRTAVFKESSGKGQGFLWWSCAWKCVTRQCNCVKEKSKCNSHCHWGSLHS